MSEEKKEPTVPDSVRQVTEKVMQSKEKIVPTVYRHVVVADWFRKFTFRERLMIALGANFLVMIRIPTQHNPGKLQPVIVGNMSNHPTPDSHMRERMENLLEAQKSSIPTE